MYSRKANREDKKAQASLEVGPLNHTWEHCQQHWLGRNRQQQQQNRRKAHKGPLPLLLPPAKEPGFFHSSWALLKFSDLVLCLERYWYLLQPFKGIREVTEMQLKDNWLHGMINHVVHYLVLYLYILEIFHKIFLITLPWKRPLFNFTWNGLDNIFENYLKSRKQKKHLHMIQATSKYWALSTLINPPSRWGRILTLLCVLHPWHRT